jgi:hypothetical protein
LSSWSCQQVVGEIPLSRKRFQAKEVDGARVNVGRVPLFEEAPVGVRFARNIGYPGMVAQLDQRRAHRGGAERSLDRLTDFACRAAGFPRSRMADVFERLPE